MLTADVKTSELSDALIVVPRLRQEEGQLVRALRKMMPDAVVSRVAEGAQIRSLDAGKLLGVANNIDLRWTPEAEAFARNRDRVARAHANVHAAVRSIRDGGKEEALARLAGVELIDGLDDHQIVNVAAMTVPGGFGLCVFDEQGTGKTVTTIAAIDVLVARGDVDVVLIVAPKSMIAEWPQDFARMTGNYYSVSVLAGSRREKLATLRQDSDVIVAGFETAIGLEAELTAILRQRGGKALLVVDESFYVKNLDAQRTRVIRRLREWCERAFVLCGTPAPNSPSDVVQQFNIVDLGVTFDALSKDELTDASSDVFQGAMEARGCYIRHLKSDVLPDLPARLFHRVPLPLQPKQATLYHKAASDLETDLATATDQEFRDRLTTFMGRRTSLLQICSNPIGVDDNYRETPAKLLALDEILEDLIDRRREKVVIWSFYTASLNQLCSRYARWNPVRYDGTVDDINERRQAVRKFQDDDDTMLFVGNPAAAGAGLTLHRARFAIYESMSNQAAHYLQSLDRIHRRGQTKEVEYLVLLCEGTIENEEYERLIAKEQAAQTLLGDNVEPAVSRQSMLAELLRSRETSMTNG